MSENDPRLQIEFGCTPIPASKGDGTPAPRILLACEGDMQWAGDDCSLDRASAERVIAAFAKQAEHVPVDYHHATLRAESRDGTKAPAAGWIKSLEYVAGEGLYAAVDWVKTAADEIRKEEYKYYSPVFWFDKRTNTPLTLHSVALTNRPLTKGMTELLQAAERLAEQENAVMAEQSKELDAKIAEAVKAQMALTLKELKAAQEEGEGEGLGISPEQKLFIKLAMALELGDDAQPVDILTAAINAIGGGSEEEAPEAAEKKAAEKLGCKSFDEAQVKVAQYDTVAKELKELKGELAEQKEIDAKAAAKTLVQEQVDLGKLLPDSETAMAAALKHAENDPEGFAATFEGIPAVAGPGRLTAVSGPATANERDKVIKAASKEFAEDPMMRTGQTEIKHYINVALREDGQTELTDAETKALKGAA